MDISNIGWTGATWNPVIGCSKVNSLCDNCYMYRQEERYGNNPALIRKGKTTFYKPLKLKNPSVIFTSSLTDFFHSEIDQYRVELWEIIAKCPHHIFQILTKRAGRIKKCLPADWYSNPEKWKHVWLGCSIGGDPSDKTMVSKLIENNASVLFLSVEPLIGSVEPALLDFVAHKTTAKKWVIVGGESGNGKMPDDPQVKYKYRESSFDWFNQVVNACKHFDIPVFVKQLGKHLAKQTNCKTENGTALSELPTNLQVRQFPIDVSKYVCNQP